MDSVQSSSAHELFLDTHEKREHLWLRFMKEEKFKSALMICGEMSGLSLGSLLRSEGFEVKADLCENELG